MTTSIDRVRATSAALGFIAELWQRHGTPMFFQSGGCCDGSAPMCYPAEECNLSDTDVYLGNLDSTPFYMGLEQFAYCEHTQLSINVVEGNGGMFSLDNGTGRRFLTRSRVLPTKSAHCCAANRSHPGNPGSFCVRLRKTGLAEVAGLCYSSPPLPGHCDASRSEDIKRLT